MARVATCGMKGTDNITLRVYDADTATPIWTAAHGGVLYGVVINSQGAVIVGGAPGTGGYTLRKYSYDGDLIWSVVYGSYIFAIALDSSENILVGGISTSYDYFLSCLSSDGSSDLWSTNPGSAVNGICRHPEGGFVATGGRSAENYTTWRYTEDRELDWSYDHGATTTGVMANNHGVFVVGAAVSSNTVRYLSLSGSLISSYAFSTTVNAIANGDADDLDSSYIVYAGAVSSSRTTAHHEYDDAVTDYWYKNHGATVYGIATDNNGNVYTVGAAVSGTTTRKYSALSDVDTEWNRSHGNTLYAVTWSASEPTVVSSSAPGLALSFLLGSPGAGRGDSIPGLALSFPLAAPTSVGALPPDGRLTPLPVLYRGYLSGPTDIEFPLISLQCTRRLGQSTWLVVEVMYTPERAAAIAARADGQLIIYAGVRNALGQELLGEFARAWLTEVEATQEPGAGRLILTGRLVPTPFTAQARTLLKVTQRQVVDGRHEVRCCAVDPLLRPNDTVVDGAESWIAGTIHYRISAREAFMQVTEVGD